MSREEEQITFLLQQKMQERDNLEAEVGRLANTVRQLEEQCVAAKSQLETLRGQKIPEVTATITKAEEMVVKMRAIGADIRALLGG
jgi:septal ring factor EnvC (AmiA/AmiB activator)